MITFPQSVVRKGHFQFHGAAGHWRPIIAVPARNEARRLPTLLGALGKQSWLDQAGRLLPVVIVLNNCTDNSVPVAIEAVSRHPKLLVDLINTNFPSKEAHVGSARRLAMNKAWRATSDSALAVIITTDADAAPEPSWVEANLRAMSAGADIVGGLIVGDPEEEIRLGPKFLRRARNQSRYALLADRLASMIDPLPYDPWPRHHDHIGASLAVRADVYAAVGGLHPLPRREDLEFVSRVRAAGYRLRHLPDVSVKVSARLNGRAAGGMADCIRGWVKAEAEGLPHLVEAPQMTAARSRRRRMMRYRAAPITSLFDWPGAKLRSSSLPYLKLASSSVSSLIEMLAPDEPDAIGTVPIDLAIEEIQQMISALEGQARAA